MRVRAVIAGICVALTACSGCAALGPPIPDEPEPGQWERRLALSREARKATEAGQYGRALAILNDLTAEDPRSAEAHYRIGRIHEKTGRLDLAAIAYRAALDRDNEYVDAMVGLGRIEATGGRFEEALNHYDTAIEIDPTQAEAHVGRGGVLEALGRTDEAQAAYFRALRCDPDTTAALLRTALILLSQGHPESALARLDHLVELTPDDPEARFHRGRARLALNLTDGAIDDLRYAASHMPDRPDVFYALSLAHEQARDLTAALAAADRLIELAPGSAAVQDLSRRLKR